ncbi:MAG: DUF433 domain-containing protein [Hymenobacter sp.]|nr:MAG: DUF433 domain-containing protein [Hymenobacter sp.]
MSDTLQSLYAGQAVYRLPLYTVRQAAHLTGLPLATAARWTATDTGLLIRTQGETGLSFLNLIELHVLAAIRRLHQLPLGKVRHAVQYVRQEFGTDYPLAERQFETDGVDLFIRELDMLINASRRGQVAIRELVTAYLQRIERDATGFPLRLYPLYRADINIADEVQQAPAIIAVDPTISFGRPVLIGSGIPVEVVISRYRAGDSIRDLVADYHLPEAAVEEALRYELGLAA